MAYDRDDVIQRRQELLEEYSVTGESAAVEQLIAGADKSLREFAESPVDIL